MSSDQVYRETVRTMHALGMFDGSFDPRNFVGHPGASPYVPCVAHPGDAVCLWYDDKRLYGGVTVGKMPLFAADRTPLDGFPVDMLLGWLDEPSKSFRWALRGSSAVLVPLSMQQGCLAELVADAMTVPHTAEPVWLTFGDLALHDVIQKTGDVCPDMTTYLDDILAEERRKAFWEASHEEFIRTTWHPKRIIHWCLDVEEQKDLGVFLTASYGNEHGQRDVDQREHDAENAEGARFL